MSNNVNDLARLHRRLTGGAPPPAAVTAAAVPAELAAAERAAAVEAADQLLAAVRNGEPDSKVKKLPAAAVDADARATAAETVVKRIATKVDMAVEAAYIDAFPDAVTAVRDEFNEAMAQITAAVDLGLSPDGVTAVRFPGDVPDLFAAIASSDELFNAARIAVAESDVLDELDRLVCDVLERTSIPLFRLWASGLLWFHVEAGHDPDDVRVRVADLARQPRRSARWVALAAVDGARFDLQRPEDIDLSDDDVRTLYRRARTSARSMTVGVGATL